MWDLGVLEVLEWLPLIGIIMTLRMSNVRSIISAAGGFVPLFSIRERNCADINLPYRHVQHVGAGSGFSVLSYISHGSVVQGELSRKKRAGHAEPKFPFPKARIPQMWLELREESKAGSAYEKPN